MGSEGGGQCFTIASPAAVQTVPGTSRTSKNTMASITYSMALFWLLLVSVALQPGHRLPTTDNAVSVLRSLSARLPPTGYAALMVSGC